MKQTLVLTTLCTLSGLACSPATEPPTSAADDLDTYVYVPTAADEVFAVEDVREENVACHAPSPPPPPGDILIQPAFTDYLPADGLDRVIQLVQDPVDDEHWFLVNQRAPIQRFGPQHDSPIDVLDLTDDIFTGHHETGTIDLVFHPQFPEKRHAYVTYSAKGGSAQFDSRVSRFEVNEDMTFERDSELILFVEPQTHGSHSLNHLVFGPDGMLYIAVGDGGNGFGQANGQDTSNTKGTILRIDVDNAEAPLAYAIPADNPFVAGGGRAEIWAYGFRNVWRFSFDSLTGDLWAGDVGQNTHEEINLVERGGNYGWAVMEGDLCFGANDLLCDNTGMIDPVVSIDHVEGVSVTGGFVYRGELIPAIEGHLVYGDFGTGNIWTLNPESGEVALQLESGVGIASFAEARDKRLYVVGYSATGMGNIYEIVSNDVGPSDFPRLLSETGCVDMAQPAEAPEGVHEYSVQVELWSDGAEKERFVAMPDDRRIDVADNGDFHFPPGTVLVKHFKFEERYHETRLLIRHDDGAWAGYSYEWNEEQTDAALLDVGKTKALEGGHLWRYPTRGQCLRCHGAQSLRALGPEVVQLQAPPAEGEASVLEQWFEQGFFVPEFEALDELPGYELAPLPALKSEASLEERARAYLHVNCANCHQPDGIGQGTMDFRWQTPLEEMGVCEVKPEEGQMWLSGTYWLLAPGDPDHSLMLLRMETLNKFRMPDLGSHVVDEEGVSLIRDWISSISACP